MPISEASLKGELCKLGREILSGFVIIRHEDHFTHGIPDVSFTGDGRTVWVEAKYDNKGFHVKGIQELTMKRLAKAGRALFVVYWERKNERRTYVLNPSEIAGDYEDLPHTGGWNHGYVLRHIKRAANDND